MCRKLVRMTARLKDGSRVAYCPNPVFFDNLSSPVHRRTTRNTHDRFLNTDEVNSKGKNFDST